MKCENCRMSREIHSDTKVYCIIKEKNVDKEYQVDYCFKPKK